MVTVDFTGLGHSRMLDAIAPALSSRFLLFVFGLATISLHLWQRQAEERKIRKLGSRAPSVRSWLPLGLDTLIKALNSHVTNHNPEFWAFLLRHGASPESPTVEAQIAGTRVIFTADTHNLRAILASQFNDYGKGQGFRNDWHGLLGDSVFSLDGEGWHGARQLLRPQFIKDRISDLTIFEKFSGILVRGLTGGDEAILGAGTDIRGVGKEVDVTSFIHRYTLDTATEFLFGKSVGSLEDINNEFAEAFEEAQRALSTRTRAGPGKAFFSNRKLSHALRVINTIAFPYIDAALALDPAELASKSTDESYTFLHALVSVSRSRTFLRDQIVSLLLAGRDTTAAVLIWTLFELARNPAMYTKLRREVLDTVGERGMPTYAHLKGMKYLQATMNETLRLYPLPYNIRIALRDTTLPRGGGPDGSSPVGVPAGTPVGFSTYDLHHNAALYPSASEAPLFPAVEEYNPERWLSWHPRPWTYIPFSGGPRICLGQQWALAEMGYTLVKIAQMFTRLEWDGEESDMKRFKTDIMIEPVAPLKMRFFSD